jgi:hypothetical protein
VDELLALELHLPVAALHVRRVHDISGANAATYAPAATDADSTIDAIVSATNTGGGTDANALPTSAIAAASVVVPPVVTPPVVTPPAGGGGGGGGGGGTGGALDLAVTGYVSPSTALLGQDVTFVLYGDDLTPNQLANVYLNVALPAGVTYVSAQADRGSGCKVVAANSLSCFSTFCRDRHCGEPSSSPAA